MVNDTRLTNVSFRPLDNYGIRVVSAESPCSRSSRGYIKVVVYNDLSFRICNIIVVIVVRYDHNSSELSSEIDICDVKGLV